MKAAEGQLSTPGWRLPIWLRDGFLTIAAVYAVQFLLSSLFISEQISPSVMAKPFSYFPSYIYLNWDAVLYRDLYAVYDKYFWPPLYPFTLRLLTIVCGFDFHSFEKSALLLNVISHLAISSGITYYLSLDDRGSRLQAPIVIFLLFFFPGHNVFFAAYSESFYLAISIVAFILRRQERLLAASVVGGISALVRTMGTFLVAALFAEQLLYSLRERKIRWRPLLRVTPGLMIVVAWQSLLYFLGTTVMEQNSPWAQELNTTWIHGAMNVKVWILQYLAFSSHWLEVFAFWSGLAALVYCWKTERWTEMFYICFLYLSLSVYVYRPFPWSRIVSILFPVQMLAAALLRGKPRLTAFILIIAVLVGGYIQLQLFGGHLGEP